MPSLALGVDIGSTNTKVLLAQVPDGTAAARAHASARTPTGARELVATVAELVAEVLGRFDARPDVVGIASMAETGVPLDGDGDPLTELLRWDGHRAGAQAAVLAETHGAQALFDATGVRPSAKVPLATWAWLRDEGVLARMHRWAGTADFVALAMTGELVTDHTLAGRTMGYRMPASGPPDSTFDSDLVGSVGLRVEQLPRVARPESVAGHLRRGVGPFVDAGIAPGTPVVVAGHDHAVGAWGAGVRLPGDRADSIGTAEAIMTVLPAAPDPVRTAAAGMSWVRTVTGRHHAVLAGSSSAGAMIGWLGERLSSLGRQPMSREDALHRAADELARNAGPTGVVVLPYLSGRQTPAPDPAARVRVVPEVADPVLLTRAVLEGVCLQARWMLAEQAVELGGAARPAEGRTRPLTVLGGPALTSPAWAETKRLVTAEPVRWVSATEPVAFGAALLGATRAGLLGDDVEALLAGDVQAGDVQGGGAQAGDVLLAGEALVGGDAQLLAPADPHVYDRMYEDFVETALGRAAGPIRA